MAAALDEARRAGALGEVPIGAVVAIDGDIVGRGFNQPITSGDPTAHAEIVAIREAARTIGNYRLTGATLVVTIEPCLMCVGALVHARIGTLVYGAAEPRSGALVSTVRGGELPGQNHRFEVVGGVREDECRALMQAFFSPAQSGGRGHVPSRLRSIGAARRRSVSSGADTGGGGRQRPVHRDRCDAGQATAALLQACCGRQRQARLRQRGSDRRIDRTGSDDGRQCEGARPGRWAHRPGWPAAAGRSVENDDGPVLRLPAAAA